MWSQLVLLAGCLSVALGCSDVYEKCDQYTQAYCTHPLHKGWMERNCKKFCGLCSTGGGNENECGMVKIAKSRVVGGEDAIPGEWPWQIGITRFGRFHCGGSLINPFWIVTAAHCLYQTTEDMYEVTMGDHNRLKDEGEQKRRISKMIVHEKYDSYQLNNDIALIKLDVPVVFNDRVQPVCLPTKDERPAVDSKCYITGWGKMKHPGNSVDILQKLELTVEDNTLCNMENGKYFPITKQMVCAANPGVVKNQSGCHGDSGGPFVCKQANGSWKLHGAVSWGSPYCDASDAYTVFARVSEFRDWIDANIQ